MNDLGWHRTSPVLTLMASARAFDACESSSQLSNYRHERNHEVAQYRSGGTQVDFAPPPLPPAQLQDHDREESDKEELMK